ncbi:tripartite tricarboxylate transporter TctB family protein [Nocardiopsis algeriensis]|uniref:DUF1468 domain-containing protein n=1 Tax=Nocardiopsis algeriensis TaxID=1478215 RepID=A0A841IUA8_9ACTN|nr:hypothetical protein [Nocardiopsis algeriensis]
MSPEAPGTGAPSPAEEGARSAHPLRDLVPAAAGAALAVGAFVLTLGIPVREGLTQIGPRWWPEVLSGALLLLAVLLVAGTLRKRSAKAVAADTDIPDPATREGAWRLVAMLGSILGYGVLWYFVDFRVSTALLFAALTWIGGGRGWKALLLFPVVVTTVLHLLFGVLLRVPL